ncbi:MAG: hypothetical protein J0M04_21750 [Verrucomicrobia bacterium]|nr:hypothetical protein [Verrucomicrobiota bacterium]
MKSKLLCGTLAAALILSASVTTGLRAESSPSPTGVPTGSLSVSHSMVRVGARPVLNWNITYPSVVQNYVTVVPPGTVQPKENLICDVRILGAGVTAKASNSSNYTFVRTEGRMRVNGSSTWTTIFDGVNTDQVVKKQNIIKTFNITKGQAIDFGGRYYYNNSWSTQYTSLNGDNVRTLVNGQTPPSNVPDYNAPSLESFLRPYLDSSGKVKIGPMDVIVFMELTHTDKSDIGYDLQDLVLLVTFRKS